MGHVSLTKERPGPLALRSLRSSLRDKTKEETKEKHVSLALPPLN